MIESIYQSVRNEYADGKISHGGWDGVACFLRRGGENIYTRR